MTPSSPVMAEIEVVLPMTRAPNAPSTAPGAVAADGTGRNSPYTEALTRAMREMHEPVRRYELSNRADEDSGFRCAKSATVRPDAELWLAQLN